MKKIGLVISGLSLLLLPRLALAHCPLCTIGAGAAAMGASLLGIGSISIGIFIGAFGWALGLWIGRLLPRRFRYQDWALGLFSFVFTVWPLTPLMPGYFSYYLMWGGDYGSLTNRTYIFSHFWFGSILGSLILLAAPTISSWVSKQRGNKLFPYQGMLITFGLLFLISLLIELLW